MKRIVIACLLLVLLFAFAPARAVINPEDNVIGPYFDTSADLDCVEGMGMNAQIPVYIILTNPTFSEVRGFELGVDLDGNLMLLGEQFANSQALNVGGSGNYIVGYGQPTYTEQATLLMTLNLLHLGTADTPSHIVLHASSPSSVDVDYPAIITEGLETIPAGLHSEYRNFVSLINGSCSFEREESSWDGVKSLYRQ